VKSALAAILIVTSGAAWAGAQRPTTAGNTSITMDQKLAAYRADLQSNRSDVIAKNVRLTTAQADGFWPLFEQYQREQSAIMDEQMKGIQDYISSSEKMDDVAVLRLMHAHLDRDARMAELRRRWLSEFLQVLPVKQAVRVMQIDRRLSLAHQTDFTSQIPLAQ
jgi:Spy/CpxP family protein refolding chaperone